MLKYFKGKYGHFLCDPEFILNTTLWCMCVLWVYICDAHTWVYDILAPAHTCRDLCCCFLPFLLSPLFVEQLNEIVAHSFSQKKAPCITSILPLAVFSELPLIDFTKPSLCKKHTLSMLTKQRHSEMHSAQNCIRNNELWASITVQLLHHTKVRKTDHINQVQSTHLSFFSYISKSPIQ